MLVCHLLRRWWRWWRGRWTIKSFKANKGILKLIQYRTGSRCRSAFYELGVGHERLGDTGAEGAAIIDPRGMWRKV